MTDEQLQCVDVWDDGVTWAEGHLRRAELEHIVVCHAVHDICTHKPYSIPDLLRLNDFWWKPIWYASISQTKMENTIAHTDLPFCKVPEGWRYCQTLCSTFLRIILL